MFFVLVCHIELVILTFFLLPQLYEEKRNQSVQTALFGQREIAVLIPLKDNKYLVNDSDLYPSSLDFP